MLIVCRGSVHPELGLGWRCKDCACVCVCICVFASHLFYRQGEGCGRSGSFLRSQTLQSSCEILWLVEHLGNTHTHTQLEKKLILRSVTDSTWSHKLRHAAGFGLHPAHVVKQTEIWLCLIMSCPHCMFISGKRFRSGGHCRETTNFENSLQEEGKG